MRKIITTMWVTLDGYIAHEMRNEVLAGSEQA